jgi:hypothetical protein
MEIAAISGSCERASFVGLACCSLLQRAMAEAREIQVVVQRTAATTVATPMTLGFGDCLAVVVGLLLMLLAAAFPGSARSE